MSSFQNSLCVCVALWEARRMVLNFPAAKPWIESLLLAVTVSWTDRVLRTADGP